MTHIDHTAPSASSWAVKSLTLNGTAVNVGRASVGGAFPGTSATTPRIDTSAHVAAEITGDGGTPAAGDLLIAAVICKTSGGQALTPPAGWTTLTPLTGVGTSNVLLATFWKVAASGDITGGLTFHAVNSTDLVAYVFSIPQASINTASPIVNEADAVSSVSSTSFAGPDAPSGARSVFELVATRPSSLGTSTRSDSGVFYVLVASENGGGTGTPDNCNVAGFRFYLAATAQALIDEIG